ncbi:hypothetical protein ALC53_12757, partial [Atta colombica]
SVVTDHGLQGDHEFDWENVIILNESHRKKLVSKMLFIRRQADRRCLCNSNCLEWTASAKPRTYVSLMKYSSCDSNSSC